LVRAANSAGLLYSTHMRNESSRLLDAVEEAIDTADRAPARLEISHLKAMGPANHGRVGEALALLDAARARGVDVAADVYPYTASSTALTSRLPAWALDGGAPALLHRLADKEDRARIADELRGRFGRDIDPEGVIIADLGRGRYRDWIGKSIADIGRSEHTDPAEAALRVLECHDATVSIVNHAMSEQDVGTVLAHPYVSVASDGATLDLSGKGRPHPRSFGTFARVLGRYVRERGLLTLEEAVRKMTSLPASRIRIADRGVLRVGAAADIAVFDPATVTDNSTFDNPWQLAGGFSTVLVNGVPTLLNGQTTGRAGGQVLRPV
jgi:N-acyl-D-amino-acid deacylase